MYTEIVIYKANNFNPYSDYALLFLLLFLIITSVLLFLTLKKLDEYSSVGLFFIMLAYFLFGFVIITLFFWQPVPVYTIYD